MADCCALRQIRRYFRVGPPAQNDPFTCDRCGQSYRYRGWRWVPVSTVDEITELNATDPRATKPS